MTFQLLFIGSPLLDVSLICESEYLEKYELKADNCIRATKDHKTLFDELLQNPDSVFEAGGSAQNSARICKASLGDDGIVSFTGCIGKDDVGIEMRNQLQRSSVVPLYITHTTLPTGICACLGSANGERSMVTQLGAAATYDVQHLTSPQVESALQKADYIFIVGYFLSHSAEVVQHVAKFCHENNKLFSLSLSAPYVCKTFAHLLMECMPYIDIVFGNCEEAKILLKSLNMDLKNESPVDIAKLIAELPKANNFKRVVVITNGSKPVTVCVGGEESEEYTVPKIEDFVEATGCGDALAGAFLANFIRIKSVETSVEAGIIAACKVGKSRGCVINDG